MQMFQIGDWVTQYSVGYWQVVDIKAKYAEEDSGYGSNFGKKGGANWKVGLSEKSFYTQNEDSNKERVCRWRVVQTSIH